MQHFFRLFASGIEAGLWNEAFPPPFEVQTAHQVHGTQLIEVRAYQEEPEADALMTRVPGLCIAVKTADCIPLLVADPAAGLVAAIHAGWRGLTADIIPKTLASLIAQGADPRRIQVGIGPSLGSACAVFSNPYEEIPKPYHWAILEDKTVDLNGIAREQLLAAGVSSEHLEWVDVCTHCDSAWPSWRRDQTSQRFLTWIRLQPRSGKTE